MPQVLVRTRFAPSPTGYLHIGGLRTALYSYLFAKQHQGQFILRLEDTDQKRSVKGATQAIFESLRWAGLVYDEGPDIGGPYGPYVQSQRLDRYRTYADELVQKELAYYCFCDEQTLADMREKQIANKRAPKYDRRCLTLSKKEIQQKLHDGQPKTIRMKMPDDQIVSFSDLIRGAVVYQTRELDDQVLMKSDGFPTYHLAVVVDDHLMHITHVTRTEEWLPSTPKHILLYQYFDWEAPAWAHLPLLLNPDKSKMSKRKGDVAVEEYRTKGYLPEALINYLALLGWNPGTEKELFTMAELLEAFSLERVHKAGAVFSIEKLNWFNVQAIRRLPEGERLARVRNELHRAYPNANLPDDRVRDIVALLGDRIERFADVPEAVRFLFNDEPYDAQLPIPKKGNADETHRALQRVEAWLQPIGEREWSQENLQKLVDESLTREALDRRNVLWPLRVALTFRASSPGVFEVLEFLGKNESIRRVERAIALLAAA